MIKVHRKLIAVLLVLLLGVGSVANAAAGVIACLPKSCCCTVAASKMPDHHEMMAMPIQMPVEKTCSPTTPAPCCQVEPYQPATDAALSALPNYVPHRMIHLAITADVSEPTPELSHHNFKTFRDDGLSKIPWIPIWLETLSILC